MTIENIKSDIKKLKALNPDVVVPAHGLDAPLHYRSLWYTAGVVIICHALAHYGVWKKLAASSPAMLLGFGYAALLTLALVLTPDAGKAFIYFQF